MKMAQRFEVCRDIVNSTSGANKSRSNRHVTEEPSAAGSAESPSYTDLEAIATSVAERVVARVMEAKTSGQSTSGSTTPVATGTPQQTSPNDRSNEAIGSRPVRRQTGNRRNVRQDDCL